MALCLKHPRIRRTLLAALWVCVVPGLHAGPAETVPAGELQTPPSERRVEAVVEAARRDGWATVAPVLRTASFEAYATGNLESARAWLNLARWAGWLGEPETVAVEKWIQAIESAGLAHPNLPRSYEIRRGVALSARLSPGAQAGLAGDPAFLDAFFAQLSPFDYPPGVLTILGRLHDGDPDDFRDYRNLAIAIAVVHDTAPPPWWPHGQVSPAALPRKWPDALATFRFFVAQDQAGRCYLPLKRLGADELKFVVDAAAPFDELTWAQKVVDVPLAHLDKVYSMVPYRVERLQAGRAVWPGDHYSLPLILGRGGICVDQAYFACEVGKARGVPTLLFMGAGMDGRHAWFGYLDGDGHWRLDAGRYAEQRLETGRAIDPQTWGWMTDHEIRFLSERFQRLASTRRSRIQSDFARAFLGAGDDRRAVDAAEDALRSEDRNLAAWQVLLDASRRRGDPPAATEIILGRACHAFRRYPDLESHFNDLLVASLRARGETSRADHVQAGFIRAYGRRRADLAIREAARKLASDFDRRDLVSQIGDYNRVVDQYGAEGGAVLFDQVVRVFVEHLVLNGRIPEARRALERARAVMHVVPETPLAMDFDALERRVRATP